MTTRFDNFDVEKLENNTKIVLEAVQAVRLAQCTENIKASNRLVLKTLVNNAFEPYVEDSSDEPLQEFAAKWQNSLLKALVSDDFSVHYNHVDNNTIGNDVWDLTISISELVFIHVRFTHIRNYDGWETDIETTTFSGNEELTNFICENGLFSDWVTEEVEKHVCGDTELENIPEDALNEQYILAASMAAFLQSKERMIENIKA
ncbi:hypothetical protein [Vibrio alginolyticus]|uniref:hypothetical protein n=1 Tax=Vibrio TaxID=662 RepID=UPI0006CA7F37|nr:hypothetical protein [Vibrio alginolyticus]KPM98370.1 hypothetical protein AOG25_07945 [Vibrio alginolyticus]CAH7129732.1 conserved hypothetical protein [Vibrio chagasii]CAH7221177.1 conserved hypothetical protein [Vibrio chagasii]